MHDSSSSFPILSSYVAHISLTLFERLEMTLRISTLQRRVGCSRGGFPLDFVNNRLINAKCTRKGWNEGKEGYGSFIWHLYRLSISIVRNYMEEEVRMMQ